MFEHNSGLAELQGWIGVQLCTPSTYPQTVPSKDFRLLLAPIQPKLGDFRNISTIFNIHIFIGSTTLQFLQFWYQNGVNILFLVVKPIEVTSGFILKLMKKIARWRRCWNIWHLSLKTKISPLVVRYQESNGCQKNWQDLRNSDLEVYCANIQPKLKKLRSSTKNQSFLMASGGFLKFTQYWLNISALTQQIYL